MIHRGLHNLLIVMIEVAKRFYRPLRHHTAAVSLTGGLAKGETAGQGSIDRRSDYDLQSHWHFQRGIDTMLCMADLC